jgi:hypothetical protein
MLGAPARSKAGEGRRKAGRLTQVCVRLSFGIGVVVTSWMCALTAPVAHGQEVINAQQEYNVKAVYLYSFGRYFLWPEKDEESSEPFVIGVFEENPFGDALDRIAQKKQIQGRPISIRLIDEIQKGKSCQILFVPKTVSSEEQAEIIEVFGKRPVLVVGEMQNFADRGGTVNFFMDDGTVRFEINVDVVREQGLSVDAKLLSLAKTIKRD